MLQASQPFSHAARLRCLPASLRRPSVHAVQSSPSGSRPPGGPLRRRDIRHHNILHPQNTLERRCHRIKSARSANKRLHENEVYVSPNKQLVGRTHMGFKRNDLFIVLVYCRSMVKPDDHPKIVSIGPTMSKDQIGNVKRNTL